MQSRVSLKRKKKTSTVADRLRCGRPRSTTKREDRNLIRLSLTNRRACPKLIKSEFEDCTGKSISTRTVSRRLLMGGLKACVVAKKPMLTARHRKSQLQWAGEKGLGRESVG